MATIVKGTYVQTAKKAAEFAADITTIWSKNQLLIEEDTLKMKVGDGINVFSQLKYATVSPTEVQKLIADSSHSHINKAVLDQINQDMVERMKQEAVTPIANVKATDDGAEITITDYKGTTKAEIKNGKVPSTLPNPNKLTLSGLVTAEYDGSSEVSVHIPEPCIFDVVKLTDVTSGHSHLEATLSYSVLHSMAQETPHIYARYLRKLYPLYSIDDLIVPHNLEFVGVGEKIVIDANDSITQESIAYDSIMGITVIKQNNTYTVQEPAPIEFLNKFITNVALIMIVDQDSQTSQIFQGNLTNVSNGSITIIEYTCINYNTIIKFIFKFDMENEDNPPTVTVEQKPIVPAALPNPNKLTFEGAVTAEYDGSSAVTIDLSRLSEDLSEYQKKTDNTLNTTDKSIPGAINEVRSQLNNIENQTTLGIAEDGLLYIFMNGVKVGNGIDVKNMQEIISNLVAVFTADFGGSAPLASQFYSWENRVYGSAIYDALSNIQCVDNIAHLTSVYDSENSRWTKQMMCTGGLFESDNFICEFEAKFDEKAGSWNNVITYGTGTHWTNRLYSDGVKWSAGGEIDAFEQAGGYSESPTNFKTPTVHWGSGTESGYPNTNEVRQGNIITFTTSEWHKFKFQLLNGYVKIWIDDILVGENDFSDCVVNNNYLYDYKPFLKPQAFYIDGSCADSSDSSNTYDFQVKNFKIYQDANIECTGLEIYPQMWEKGTELVFPTGAELFFDKIFTPSNTSNKACKWESSDTSVATVCEGYVKTLAEGTTTIKATCGDINTTYELTVNNTSANAPCAKVLISSSDLSLNNGDTSDLITYKYPKFTTDEIKYSSDNEQVATVDTTGKITSVGVGNCNIIATCGTKIDSIALTVVESNGPTLKYDLSGAITKINDRYANWSSDSSDEVYEIENKGSMGNIGNINLNIGSSSGHMMPYIIPKSSDVIIPKNNSWMWIIKGYNPTTTGNICKLKLNPTTNVNNMPCITYTPNNSTIFIRYGGINMYNLSSIANIIVIGHDDTGYYLWIDGQIVATGGSKTDVGYLYDIYGMKIDDLGLMRSQNNVDNISSFLNNLDMAVYLNSREDIETILTKDFGYVK